jgi:hypothetical protein
MGKAVTGRRQIGRWVRRVVWQCCRGGQPEADPRRQVAGATLAAVIGCMLAMAGSLLDTAGVKHLLEPSRWLGSLVRQLIHFTMSD